MTEMTTNPSRGKPGPGTEPDGSPLLEEFLVWCGVAGLISATDSSLLNPKKNISDQVGSNQHPNLRVKISDKHLETWKRSS